MIEAAAVASIRRVRCARLAAGRFVRRTIRPRRLRAPGRRRRGAAPGRDLAGAPCAVPPLEPPEFDRRVLDPARAAHAPSPCPRARRPGGVPCTIPALAAMNPAPAATTATRCATADARPDQIARYRGRLSVLLLDRIDLVVEAPRSRPGARPRPGGRGVRGRARSGGVRGSAPADRPAGLRQCAAGGRGRCAIAAPIQRARSCCNRPCSG